MPAEAGTVVVRVTSKTAQAIKGLRGVGNEIRGVAGKIKQHSRAIGLGMTAMGGAIVYGLKKAVSTAADFQQAITNAASVTGKMGAEFDEARDKMEALAKTLGRTTVFTARQAADAMYDLASKGFDVAAMSAEELRPILDLAAATQADLTVATETVTSTLRAFGMENRETVRIADVFTKVIGSSAATIDKLAISMSYVAPLAKTAGVSFEHTTAALAKLYDAGIDGSTAGTMLRMVITKLITPSKELGDLLVKLGLTEKDISLQTNTLAEVLQKMKDAGMEAADAMKLFGARAGPSALILTDIATEGSAATDAIHVLEAELLAAGGTAKTVAKVQLNTLSGQLKLLASAVESVVIPLGATLIPRLTETATKAAGVAQRISEWIEIHPELTEKIVLWTGALGAAMLVIGPMLIALPGLVTALGLLAPALALFTTPLGIAVAAGGAIYIFRKQIMDFADRYFPNFAHALREIGKVFAWVEEKIFAMLDALNQLPAIGLFAERPIGSPGYMADWGERVNFPRVQESARAAPVGQAEAMAQGNITINVYGEGKSVTEIAQEVSREFRRSHRASPAYEGVAF